MLHAAIGVVMRFALSPGRAGEAFPQPCTEESSPLERGICSKAQTASLSPGSVRPISASLPSLGVAFGELPRGVSGCAAKPPGRVSGLCAGSSPCFMGPCML